MCDVIDWSYATSSCPNKFLTTHAFVIRIVGIDVLYKIHVVIYYDVLMC